MLGMRASLKYFKQQTNVGAWLEYQKPANDLCSERKKHQGMNACSPCCIHSGKVSVVDELCFLRNHNQGDSGNKSNARPTSA